MVRACAGFRPAPRRYHLSVPLPRRRAACALLALTCLCLAVSPGCATAPIAEHVRPEPGVFDAPGGGYQAAFEKAKDTLREAGFELDRVDARAGVITTHPRASAGFATPWTGVETDPGQMLDGTFNAYRRTASVSFVPLEAFAGDDLRACPTPLRGTVTVRTTRSLHPPTRLTPASIRLASRPIDPRAGSAPPSTDEEGRDDLPLAEQLAVRIREQLVGGGV